MPLVEPVTVRIDWAKDGTFGSSGLDNVTDLIRGSITASYGRDQNTAFSPIVAGSGTLNLDNRDRRYSPKNASSPLFGNLKPARPVLIERTVAGVTYTILRAHTDDAPINPDVDSRLVSLSLVDTIGDFRRAPMSTGLYAGQRTGEAIGLILDEVGWTGARDLDDGATVIPYWWEEDSFAYDALQKALASEGSPALLTVGANGAVTFRDRHHRLTSTPSLTLQGTWRGVEGSAPPVMNRGYTFDAAWRNVINDVTLTVDERQPQGELSTVWQTDETVHLGASGTRTFFASASDPFRDAVAPQQDHDYVVVSGSVASVTLSRDNGASATITITAGGSGVILQGMALRAFAVPVRRQLKTTRSSDSGSILDYGSQGLPSGTEPVWAGRWDAQSLADLYVLQRKQPLAVVTARFMLTAFNIDQLAPLILARNISDRVRIIEPETGVNDDFFIESIRHTIVSPLEHEVVFGLEEAPTAPTGPFILGTSTLNGAATLGY